MQIDNKINEAASDSIFDKGISAEDLKVRKISTARVLAQAKKAFEVAESTGQDSIAKQLQNKIDMLQDWLDHADEIPVSDGDDDDHRPDSDKGDLDREAGKDKGDGDGDGDDLDKVKSKDPDKDSDKDSDKDGDDGDDGDSADDPKKDPEKEPGKEPDKEPGEPPEDPEKDPPVDPDKDPDREPGKPPVDPGREPGDPPEDPGREPGDPPTDPKKEPGKPTKGPEGDPGEPKDPEGPEGDPSEPKDPDGPEGDPGEPKEPGKDPKEPKGPKGDPSDPDKDSDGDDGDSDDPDKSGDDDKEPEKNPDEIRIDPFKRQPPGSPPKSSIDPKKVESVFDAAKRILGKLSGEAKKGATDGLKGLLTKRGISVEESLHEALGKHLAKVSDEEFHDELAATMELVDKVIKIDYSDDLDDRIKEIESDASSAISRMELEREDAEHTKHEREAAKSYAKASEKENEKYAKVKGLSGLDVFKASLYRAIKDQVDEAEDEIETWAALDRRHEDDPDIIVKGRMLDDGEEAIPSINVYFDQSGSWTSSDIEKGIRAISVINEFHENKEIKLNIYYMSAGGIFTTAAAARRFYQAEGWAAALKHIKETKVKNAIILSDNDLDYFETWNRPTGDNGRTIIDGCVWWLWKDASVSKKALNELIGRRGNFQYQFEGRSR